MQFKMNANGIWQVVPKGSAQDRLGFKGYHVNIGLPAGEGDSLRAPTVPSLQRPQPGSEQPKLAAEWRMQQNETSTQSRQKPEGHLDIFSAGISAWHLRTSSPFFAPTTPWNCHKRVGFCPR